MEIQIAERINDISFELCDLDNYFCLFTDKKIDVCEDNYYQYDLCRSELSRKGRYHYGLKDKGKSDDDFYGSIICRTPIPINKFRKLQCCEFLGVFSNLSGYRK